MKNYLDEDELKKFDRLTLSFLDYAEDTAVEHKLMIGLIQLINY